jgi:hypothetical protein
MAAVVADPAKPPAYLRRDYPAGPMLAPPRTLAANFRIL